MTKVKKENEQAFAIHNVSGSTVTEVRQRELLNKLVAGQK